MVSRCVILFALIFSKSVLSQYTENTCTLAENSRPGTCTIVYECQSVINDKQQGLQYTLCGFEGRNEIVCCPDDVPDRIETTPAPKITSNLPISQRKCNEYSEAVYEYVSSTFLAVGAEPILSKIDKCGHKDTPLIVGGEHVKPREFPHMALIAFDSGDNKLSWSCGGTLISDEYVLTAGHCLHHKTWGDPKYIRLGGLDLLSEEDDATPETFNVSEIIPYPGFKRNLKYNDIGLLKMDRKVKLTPYIRPACLPTTFDISEKQAIATGWGHTEWAGKGSNHLMKITLTKYSYAECNQTYSTEIIQGLQDGIRDDTQICAGSRNESKDTCHGDSGGPLQVFHPSLHCMYSVIGVTSFGIFCGIIDIPGVYTRVYPYVNWISNTVWKNH